MKINYDVIEHNLEVYKTTKNILPIISQYENGDMSKSTMTSIGLYDYVSFCDFIKNTNELGHTPIMNILKWRDLKPLIEEKTTYERLKIYINRRTEKKFIEILNDKTTFDRLLNGSWKRKPKVRKNGSHNSGERNVECVDGFVYSIIPILNYVIKNNLDIYGDIISENKFDSTIKWYTHKKLSPLTELEKSQIEISYEFYKIIEEKFNTEKLKDIRKINIDYLTQSIKEKFLKIASIPDGTIIRCLVDIPDKLTKGNNYIVKNHYTGSRNVMVYIKDDTGSSNYYEFYKFEDLTKQRDDILNQLLS
jgi:hypothetical protein